MTYKEYREQRQKEFNNLPIFYAFTDERLSEELSKRNASIKNIVKIGGGGFCLLEDKQIIIDYFNKSDDLPELMENDIDFAVDAFTYEMCNHEYAINYYQGDWDVCNCFGCCKWLGEDATFEEYLSNMGFSENVVNAFKMAKKQYYKMCQENEWF